MARAWARLERFGIVLVLLIVFLLPTLATNPASVDPFHQALHTVAAVGDRSCCSGCPAMTSARWMSHI